jgi:phosphatidylserine/phosphatidylglycerophosphate/cardiolipin synthase-like enzyme/uncharacterized membrane protein YdjX (TVP38/TMEM64 family)
MTDAPVDPERPTRPADRPPVRMLIEGDTCWRVAHADRAAVLIDGEQYFSALDAALERAERSVRILAWDVHGGIRLRRREAEQGGGEAIPTLIERLDGLVRRRRGLQIWLLEWDFALLYALERQFFPALRFGSGTHRRLHFRLDGEHPLGASHHEKLVVIDDRIAFCGGFDLAACRWDTRAHRAEDPRRRDPGASDYRAFHDAMLLVDGDAARALGELTRARWQRATGQRLDERRSDTDPWPPGVRPCFRDVAVGIARTQPGGEDDEPVHEVEALHLASLRTARRWIYLENQYLTAHAIGEVLAERLAEPEGPELLIVSTLVCEGWLEQKTMGVLRARWLGRLHAADRYGRLRVLHPVVPDLDPDRLTVHAKVTIVDDRLLRIGSANLANRSMGLDSECDLAIEARDGDTETARAIAAVRDDLLAEHLGTTPDRVSEEIRTRGSLVAAVDALAGGPRTLARIEATVDPWIDQLVPDRAIFDPEQPVPPEELVRLLSDATEPERLRRVLPWLAAIVVIAALASTWRWTPLSEWVAPERLAALAQPLRAHPSGPWLVAGAIALAGLLLVPVTAMTIGSALLFGPWLGFVVASAGALSSAALGFGLGRLLWADAVRRLTRGHLQRIRAALTRDGALAVAALRLVPVAPFTVVNIAAGAAPLGFRDYALGTTLAMAPGTLVLTLVTDHARRLLDEPGFGAALTLIGIAAGAGIALWIVRRRLGGRTPRAR